MHDLIAPDRARLSDRLAELRARYPAAEPEMVAEVVREVLLAMRGDMTGREAGLLAEVEQLAQLISSARSEIAALQVDEITESHIPSATDELDAIVAHTAAATNSILESCETLDALSGEVSGDASARLQGATTQIYEACSFQDITGQRITKVVTTLKTIDAKVAQMLQTFSVARDGARVTLPVAPPPADPLLNGPQMPTSAMDQTDIDKLLASFD